MNPIAEQIASRVIARAGRRVPADAALRIELKSCRGLSRADSARIAHAVFDYYRWRGWLDPEQPVPEQIRRTTELAAAFKARPDLISDEELIQRAVPSWIEREMELKTGWIRLIQSEPTLWLRAKRGRGRALARELDATCASPLSDALRYDGEKDLFRHPGFHSGDFEIQDVASQAVGLLCDPQPGENWWDACAGEGGKTLHLSDLMENRGLIRASDRAGWRLKRLKLRAARAKCFNYRLMPWDGGVRLPTRTRFDGVLIDAPCSGVGTWQRNPHARWTTTPDDVLELKGIQQRLLSHVAPAVKTGGRLIYAVCTLTRTETSDVSDDFESRFPEFRPLTLTNPFARGNRAAHLWLWPEQTGGSGMFIAAWTKS